ncbi:Dual specificity mitogen-activated protein kinase kinase 4 [Bagarius yarrelli]|uniref:Dual specificity mitogen-activated protein kinase kinase 4 n=1 Tax=Bagarius yarrelli TaxID=175774 RepID=A0A556V7C4_BAGYA|nr:Dual specificity mitogen-activated protein kinase kinase 4 [Bagarius yarrelli]
MMATPSVNSSSATPPPPSGLDSGHPAASSSSMQTHHCQQHISTMSGMNSMQERLRTHSIESSGKLKISPEQHCDFTADDLKDLGEIGRGAYGSVNKMVYKPSGQIMAVKKHSFIQMYEERSVDVASYVCRILDQMPASPSSPMYVE